MTAIWRLGFLLVTAVGVSNADLRCGATTSSRSVILKSPGVAPELCQYRVKAANSRVCQIKLEFVDFELAQPVIRGFATCGQDKLGVGGYEFCGVNSGQHVFIPFPSDRIITLSFMTANRFLNPQLPQPTWHIKVTQMDCSAADLAAAPPSCLQYFSSTSGIIESFNFNNGRGPYIGNMQYAICLHKPHPQARIRFTVTYFSLGFGANSNGGRDTDCLSNIPSPGRSEDHLFIPGAEILTTPTVMRVDKFCGRSLMTTMVTSDVPGSFVMYFYSDKIYEGATKPEIGFRMYYEIY